MTTLRVGRTLGGMDPVFHAPRQEDLTNGANLRGLTVVPDPARWLSERHEIETDDGPRVVQTAHATRKLEMGVLLTSSLPALLADDECAHGRLATDPTPPCGCWPNELHTEPEELVVTAITEAHHGSSATDAADPDAPYGRKADGTPRKKPAPSAEHMANAARGRDEYFARMRAEKAAAAAAQAPPAPAETLAPEPEPDPTPSPLATGEGLIVGFVEQIDARLREVADLIAPLEDERDELLAARGRLVPA